MLCFVTTDFAIVLVKSNDSEWMQNNMNKESIAKK